MLSKNKIKLIHQLSNKKYRYENSLFIAEGHKCVDELLKSFECTLLAYTKEYCAPSYLPSDALFEVSGDELKSISLLETPQDVFAIFKMKTHELSKIELNGKLTLAIDGVQDAGNMGTIVRIADWFGIENIVCSKGSVDVYNPKCVQATMGALARVNVYYTDIVEFLKSASSSVELYTTTLDGENIYKANLCSDAIVVMGNEGSGVSEAVKKLCSKALYIPSFPDGRATSESLNVGVATAIVCSEFRRG